MCERECINDYSDIAIVAKRRSQVIKHIPERLAKMLEDGRLRKIDVAITGPERPAPEGTWRTGEGIYRTSVLLRTPRTKRKQKGCPKVSSRLLQ